MKNSLFLVLVIMFLGSFAKATADYVPVQLLSSVNTQNLSEVVSIKVFSDVWLSDTRKIEKGATVTGQIKKIVYPRRLERDAYLVFVPIEFTVPSEADTTVPIPNPRKSKVRPVRQLSKKDVASNTVGSVLARMPPFNIIVPVVQFGIGVAKPNKNEQRFHSGFRNIVESWPISYCLKGKEIPLTAGAIVEISFNDELFKSNTVKSEDL